MNNANLDALIAELRKLADAATPGPWTLQVTHGMGETWAELLDANGKRIQNMLGDLQGSRIADDFPNEQFMRDARTLVPALLDALELAREHSRQWARHSDDPYQTERLREQDDEIAKRLRGEG